MARRSNRLPPLEPDHHLAQRSTETTTLPAPSVQIALYREPLLSFRIVIQREGRIVVLSRVKEADVTPWIDGERTQPLAVFGGRAEKIVAPSALVAGGEI